MLCVLFIIQGKYFRNFIFTQPNFLFYQITIVAQHLFLCSRSSRVSYVICRILWFCFVLFFISLFFLFLNLTKIKLFFFLILNFFYYKILSQIICYLLHKKSVPS